MPTTYDDLDETQKQIADREARLSAIEVAVHVNMARDPETDAMYITSDLQGLDKEKMEEIHNAVMAVDFPYVLTQIYADDELRQQFEELVDRFARERVYEIPGTMDNSRTVVRLSDI